MPINRDGHYNATTSVNVTKAVIIQGPPRLNRGRDSLFRNEISPTNSISLHDYIYSEEVRNPSLFLPHSRTLSMCLLDALILSLSTRGTSLPLHLPTPFLSPRSPTWPLPDHPNGTLSSPPGGGVHSSTYLGVPSSPGALFPFLHPLSSGEHRANMFASLVRAMRSGGAAAVGT